MTRPTDPTKEIIASRTLNAPRDLVIEMLSTPAHLTRWWGPVGFTTTTHEMDFREGGQWRFTMHGPDGTDWPNLIQYKSITPDQIEYDHGDFEKVHFHVIIELTDEGEKTRMDFNLILPTAEARQQVVEEHGAVEGLASTINRLEILLFETIPGESFKIERTFDAPLALVWECWAKEDHFAKWWGPTGCELSVRAFDFKPGGSFHYSIETPHGQMVAKFVYHEVEPLHRLVFVSSFSNDDAQVVRAPFSDLFPKQIVNILTFHEEAGKTLIRLEGTPLNVSEAELDFYKAMFESMKGGFGGTFDKLEAHLKEL